MGIDASWKTRIVDASALDAIKVLHAECVLAPFNIPQIGPLAAPRALRTPLIDQLEAEPESVDPSIIGPRVVNAIRAGGGQEFLPFAGHSAALIHDVVPVAELVRRLVAETRMALHKANAAVIQS